ncbi:MAG: hypothetical protein ABIT04_10375 [Novosphingobium sp.]
MKLIFPLALVAAGLASCQRASPEVQTQAAARDVAMVEAAQRIKPPAVPLEPQPISFAVLDTPGSLLHLPPDVPKPTPGDECGFVPAGGTAEEAVFVAVPSVGLLKLGGRVAMLAADSGSRRLAGGLHRTYASGGNVLQLTEGDATAQPSTRKASLTIRDPYARIVYFSAGMVRCGGAASTARPL